MNERRDCEQEGIQERKIWRMKKKRERTDRHRVETEAHVADKIRPSSSSSSPDEWATVRNLSSTRSLLLLLILPAVLAVPLIDTQLVPPRLVSTRESTLDFSVISGPKTPTSGTIPGAPRNTIDTAAKVSTSGRFRSRLAPIVDKVSPHSGS